MIFIIESKLNTINQRLALLTYMQQSQPWQIEMLNTGAALHLYLQPTRNNSINILVGLLPQSDRKRVASFYLPVKQQLVYVILLVAAKRLV